MNKIEQLNGVSSRRTPAVAVMLLIIATLISGCYTTAAKRDFDRADGSIPWWCKGSPDLTGEQCLPLSLQFDVAVDLAMQYPTLEDATNAGAVAIVERPGGIGYAVSRPGASANFDPARPNVLLYNGGDAASRIAGVAWSFFGAEPTGFDGARDVWAFEPVDGNWWLSAWVIRGYQNHPNVFAATHPCLAAGVIPASTTDTCFTQSHTEPFEVLVTNDDGYGADGIAAVVDGLYGLPNITVTVVAPLANQSGSGDQVTIAPDTTSGDSTVFTTGTPPKPATAVSSTQTTAPRNGSGSPADSVLYALDVMSLSPELVISGINKGQNMVQAIVDISGTVGAARRARRNGVPSIATSQGYKNPPDFPSGVTATLALLEEWRLGIRPTTTESVLNINIPTCDPGTSIRGTVDTVVAADTSGRSYSLQDCASTETVINDDLDAFNHGFIGITDVGTMAAAPQ